MSHKHVQEIKTGTADLLFVLGLLLAFMISSLILVLIGADTYKKIAGDMVRNFEKRTPLSYIAAKIREADETNQVVICHKEGKEVLVITQKVEGKEYETWIYTYKGSLYELFAQKGTMTQLEDGMSLMSIQGLKMENLTKQLLRFETIDDKGKTLELVLALRSAQDE